MDIAALRARAARAAIKLWDHLRVPSAPAEHVTGAEFRTELATLEPVVVHEPPALAVRRERDCA